MSIESRHSTGVDEATKRGNGSGEPIAAVVEKMNERTDRRGLRDIVIKPRLAEMLIKLGVGPLQALDTERRHCELLKDEKVPLDTKISALEAQDGAIRGVERVTETMSKRALRSLSHAVPVRAEIEIYSTRRDKKS